VLRTLINRPRSVITTLLEVAGFGLIVAGVWRVSVTAGVIAAGCALILIGVLEA
jgi:small neutral amino acid transporter SnatA (MarC family)